jgi:hypothetical protein
MKEKTRMHARNKQHVEESIPETPSVKLWVQTRSTLKVDDAETLIVKSTCRLEVKCMGGFSTVMESPR